MEIPKNRLLTTEELYEYLSGKERIIVWSMGAGSVGEIIKTKFFINPIEDPENFVMQAWFIHREATWEEFLAQQPNKVTRELANLNRSEYPYLYEVSAVAD